MYRRLVSSHKDNGGGLDLLGQDDEGQRGAEEEADAPPYHFHCTLVQCHGCCHSPNMFMKYKSVIATLCLSVHVYCRGAYVRVSEFGQIQD